MPNVEIDGIERSLPIAQAAAEVAFFEKSTILRPRGDVVLGKALSAHPSARSFASVRTSATVRNFLLCDVVLDTDSLLLLKDGLPIPETAYFVSDGLQASIRVRPESLVRLADSEAAIVACNRVHDHYQHWMTQCLPAIDWSLRQARQDNVRLVLPDLASWQEDTLALLGYATVPRLVLKAGTQYLLPNAQYSEFLNGSAAFKLSHCVAATAARLADAVAPKSVAHRVIYVPCTNPYYGMLKNEADVVDLLRSRGVYILSPNSMTIAERIDLFRNADVVIGPHGEGLTDILFCKPGSVLWELHSRRLQNTCYNRLAQSAGLDYWGDLFEPVGNSQSDDWHVDLSTLAERLDALSRRRSTTAEHPAIASGIGTSHTKPVDELMMEFESLGDNCEFGLVQRNADSEPLGLLRFASIFVPAESRLERLVAALDKKFAGLGAPGTITATVEGPNREFVVRETAYDLLYHTFRHSGETALETLRESEPRRLGFLRQKFLDDLKSGEKIWVWKSTATTAQVQVMPLLQALRRHGPNTLLWVVEAGDQHPSGTVERLDDDLLKGYVTRFAPADDAHDIESEPWFVMCQRAYDLHMKCAEHYQEATQPPALPRAAASDAPETPVVPVAPSPAATRKSPILPETSLAQSAGLVREIEASEPWGGTSPTMLGQGFSAPRLQQEFGTVAQTVTLRDHLLPGVFLDTASMVLIKHDGHRIRESNYLMFPHEYDQATVRHDRVVWLDRSHDYVLGCNRDFTNYYHWMTQALPAIDWSMRNLDLATIRLALPSLGEWQEETLRMLGHAQIPRIRLDLARQYYFHRLHYSDFLSGRTAFEISAAANGTYARLRDAALHGGAAPSNDIIYVARADSLQRSIVDEQDIVAALGGEGVRIVVPGDHTVREQVALFHGAAVVIGAHGAGLTNVVFCRPGTILYELMPSFYTNPCFRRLAQAAGLAYHADIFEADGDGFVHDRAWRCDLAIILNRLRQFRQRGSVRASCPPLPQAPGEVSYLPA